MQQQSVQILTQIGLTVLAIVLYSILLSASNRAIKLFGRRQSIVEKRVLYIKKYFTATFFLVLLLSITVIWGIDFRGILIFASSFFAVVGISLFASWSILSSVTASVIIFFNFPYRIGDHVHFYDGDDSIGGTITDMTLFYIQIETPDKEVVIYPNNLAIQKPIGRSKQAPAKNSTDAG